VAEDNQHFNIQELADKWAQGKLTPEEKAYLEQWYAGFNDEDITLTASDHQNSEALRKALLNRINIQIDRDERPIRKLLTFGRIVAAASVIFVLTVGGYFIFIKPKPTEFAQNEQHDIKPGKNQATLTLANGKKIIISKNLNGVLATQGNSIVNATSGSLTYKLNGNNEAEVQYNTLTTTRGEQSPVPLVLSDGTKVWLNAASSITFPISFNGKERIVKINGEAYFEVKHNAAQPFRVETKGQTIEDIGTEFDVNAYDDEPAIRTTLVSGSVKVSQNNRSVILKPGEAAVGIEVKAGDTEQAVAWKKGLFSFKQTNIEEVMRQLSRWYDVEVSYPEGVPHTTFTGEMHRDVNASQVLDILGYFKVHFQIVAGTGGKQIIVKP